MASRAKATIFDIAREAGVSKWTVSLVLQGSGLIRPETAVKVRKAIEDVGYVYNRGAANRYNRRQSECEFSVGPAERFYPLLGQDIRIRDDPHLTDKAVAAFWYGLDIVTSQGLPKPEDALREIAFFDKGVRPHHLHQGIFFEHLALVFQQYPQKIDRLQGKRNHLTIAQ